MFKRKTKKSKPKQKDLKKNFPLGLNNRSVKVKKVEIKVNPRKIFTGILVVLLVVWIFGAFSGYVKKNLEISLSQAIADVRENKVKRIEVAEDQITLFYEDNKVALTRKEPQDSLVTILQNEAIDPSGLDIKVVNQAFSQIWLDIFINFVPLILIGIFFYVMFKQARGAQESIFSFGKSRAKPFFKGKQNVTFTDVAGIEEAKQELMEIVDFLKHPSKYRK